MPGGCFTSPISRRGCSINSMEDSDHLLIDEAQDTSPEQWDLVRALVDEFYHGQGRSEAERTLFVVGDQKQIIFSFQGADPCRFTAMYGLFSARDAGVAKLNAWPWSVVPFHRIRAAGGGRRIRR